MLSQTKKNNKCVHKYYCTLYAVRDTLYICVWRGECVCHVFVFVCVCNRDAWTNAIIIKLIFTTYFRNIHYIYIVDVNFTIYELVVRKGIIVELMPILFACVNERRALLYCHVQSYVNCVCLVYLHIECRDMLKWCVGGVYIIYGECVAICEISRDSRKCGCQVHCIIYTHLRL